MYNVLAKMFHGLTLMREKIKFKESQTTKREARRGRRARKGRTKTKTRRKV